MTNAMIAVEARKNISVNLRVTSQSQRVPRELCVRQANYEKQDRY